MVYSMTGFGKATKEEGNIRVTVETKSVNGKQADVSVRMPNDLRSEEMYIRQEVMKVLKRGKIDVNVTVEGIDNVASFTVNETQIRTYYRELSALATDPGLVAPANLMSSILGMPNVVVAAPMESHEDQEIALLHTTLKEALDQHVEFRAQEGRSIQNDLSEKIELIGHYLKEVPQYEEERIATVRDRIIDNLAKVQGPEYDNSRLEQELIYYMERFDINEEKKRLANHLHYFAQTMASDTEQQGRKLGFIAQEIGREINTLGSKSNHFELQKLVVKMKDELEKIKEQVLNAL